MVPKNGQQFIKFGLTGGLNTGLTYVIYLLLVHLTTPTVAMAVGYGLTSLVGLTLNNHWVFNAHQAVRSVAWKYYATYGFTWLLSVGFTHVASTNWQLPTWLIPIGSLMLTIPLNFLLSKFWVFSQHHHFKEARHYGN